MYDDLLVYSEIKHIQSANQNATTQRAYRHHRRQCIKKKMYNEETYMDMYPLIYIGIPIADAQNRCHNTCERRKS